MKATRQGLDHPCLTGSDPAFIATPRLNVPRYRVGEPLLTGRRHWPIGAQYHFAARGHELTLFQHDPDASTVQEVRNGVAEFALIVREPILLFAYRFGDSGAWGDVPYCWHMQPPHARIIPPFESSQESRALLWITLVGSEDGIIHAQRGMTLSPQFTTTLHAAIRRQARSAFRSDQCIAALKDLLIVHPSASERLTLARSRTIGNQ